MESDRISPQQEQVALPPPFALTVAMQPTTPADGQQAPAFKPTANDEDSRGNTTYIDD